jgi:beta-phosphoglucomutase-like phosphatase (HAD superfamily)
MSLKAILFDFNGVIINDESIHEQLIKQLLLGENLTLTQGEYECTWFGKSDRACLRDLLNNRGRVVNEAYLTKLLHKKSEAYVQELEKLEKLPIYPGLEDLVFRVRSLQNVADDNSHSIKIGLVSGAIRQEIDTVLQRANLTELFQVIIADDDISNSQSETDGYLLAVERFNQQFPDLNLQPQECLAIKNSLIGVKAAKSAGMQVVGLANSYPFHMLQRCSNWTVDYLMDLEVERVFRSPTQEVGDL